MVQLDQGLRPGEVEGVVWVEILRLEWRREEVWE